MSSDFFARLIGMLVFAVLGTWLGVALGRLGFEPVYLTVLVIGLLGALFGLVLTPSFTVRPVRYLRKRLHHAPSRAFLSGLIGLFVGLVIAALLSYPLSLLPAPFGSYFPAIGAVVFAYLGIALFVARQDEVLSIVQPQEYEDTVTNGTVRPEVTPHPSSEKILVDTSVIIDGRIEDIARTGFLPGSLLVPHFILNELQYIADSSDALRRQRGRRGMEVLARLQKIPEIVVEMQDIDVEEADTVDDKLVVLAKKTGSAILTNDYNLNRIADLQGVRVLNINELANAVKAVFLPGETLTVEIIQEGKEFGQGVGYLEDGTMIVVEDGSQHLGEKVDTIVTKVLQTAAGRMIFSRLELD